MNDFVAGTKIDFGTIILSEEDIVDFGKAFDPLDIHIDKDAARKSIFKDLIASGPHIFNHIYRKEWLPRFGKTVICGMGVSGWKFIKPVYANQKIKAEVTVVSTKQDMEIGGIAVTWLFEFKNEKGELVQFLQMEVMHRGKI
jgi:acyl dehydratase